ncbi:MAG: hypothetical protein LBF51_01755 [Zoogloeaceae bacterium]|nr:hypothetical protein [Zoogloeaceae bacterium]
MSPRRSHHILVPARHCRPGRPDRPWGSLDERRAGAGSLIPAHKSYIAQRNFYDGQCQRAGLSRMHGLRHRYAQRRHEALTGWKAPAAGGLPAGAWTLEQRARDALARRIISRELGHERAQVTAIYLGRQGAGG